MPKGILATVCDVQEAILILVIAVDILDQGRCKPHSGQLSSAIIVLSIRLLHGTWSGALSSQLSRCQKRLTAFYCMH